MKHLFRKQEPGYDFYDVEFDDIKLNEVNGTKKKVGLN